MTDPSTGAFRRAGAPHTARQLRRGLTCLAVLLAVACRNPKVMPAESELRVSPAALDFSLAPVGFTLTLPLTLQNGGRAAASTALSVDGPFAVSPVSAQVEGGGTVMVQVTFTPTEVGPASGRLHLSGGLADVPLTGQGLEPCLASQPCAAPGFDVATRRCTEAPVAEGTACTAPCLTGAGSCRGGYCLGSLGSCADSDACTIDACTSDGGCIHPAVECQVTDPCESSYCDSDAGCRSVSVDDGVPCGEATCESARVCLAGKCQSAPKPNALAECRYTLMATGGFHTCVVTRGGGLRCWGENENDQLGRGYSAKLAPPGLAVRLTDVTGVAASVADSSQSWVAHGAGGVERVTDAGQVALDASALAANRHQVCGLEHGALRCADTGPDGGTVTTVADAAVAVAMSEGELCAVLDDGGVVCGSSGALAAVALPGAARAVASAGRGTGCALLGDRVWCWGELVDGGSAVVWDGGVTAVATTRQNTFAAATACAATARGLECSRRDPLAPLEPGIDIGAVAQLSLGVLHGCALLADGHVACWGNNGSGQLGDRSSQPEGPQALPRTAQWLGRAGGWVLFSSAADTVESFQTAVGGANDDAGIGWFTPRASTVGGTRAGYDRGCPCEVDGGVTCQDLGAVPGGEPVACTDNLGGLCLASSDRQVHCYQKRADPLHELTAFDAGGAVSALAGEPAGSGTCAVLADGTVRCHQLPAWQAVTQSLTDVKELCLGQTVDSAGGCARVGAGQLRCWGSWVQSPTPIAPLGAWPVIRQVTCGLKHFCALAGANIVQCWGDNVTGQLGRDGPSSTQAVIVPMPEPVRSIAAGQSYTCALLQSGRVLCWGDNTFCQLGVRQLAHTERPLVVTQ